MSVFQVKKTLHISFVFLFDISYHVKAHVGKINPLNHHQSSPLPDFSPVSKFHIQLIFSDHFGKTAKIVSLQTSKEKVNFSIRVHELLVEFDVVKSRACPNSIFDSLMDIIYFFRANHKVLAVSEIDWVSFQVAVLQVREKAEYFLVVLVVLSSFEADILGLVEFLLLLGLLGFLVEEHFEVGVHVDLGLFVHLFLSVVEFHCLFDSFHQIYNY